MDLVLYLSGENNRTRDWHRKHDTVAAVCVVPPDLDGDLMDLLESAGVVELDANPDWFAVCADHLADVFCDLDEGPLLLYKDAVLVMTDSEVNTGLIHVMRSRR